MSGPAISPNCLERLVDRAGLEAPEREIRQGDVHELQPRMFAAYDLGSDERIEDLVAGQALTRGVGAVEDLPQHLHVVAFDDVDGDQVLP